jgi:predicted ATPase
MMDSPYSFLREVFSLRFQIQDDDSTANAHAKFEQGLFEFMGGEPRCEEKARHIGHLIGLDYSSSPDIQAALKDPRQFQRQAIFNLSQFFNAAARRGPTILLFDDLHWVDSASLAALQSVLENLSPDASLLTLCSTRPTLFERYDWPVGTRLELQPLSKSDSYRLVSQILKHIPNPPAILQELVVSRAEGNPFYLEELIKMLIDTGVILTEGEQWQVASERLVNVRVPATLVEVLQARLDELQPAELSVL